MFSNSENVAEQGITVEKKRPSPSVEIRVCRDVL